MPRIELQLGSVITRDKRRQQLTSFCSGGKKCVIYRLDIIFSMCQRSACSARVILVDIRRGISEERYQTSYHVRNVKNGNGWLFLYDTWLRYLKILQFMLMKTCQISNLRSQDVSKEILSDLLSKNVAESDKFFHF